MIFTNEFFDMKIWSTMKIEGRFTAEIDVPDTNPETIKKAMDTAYAEADFGELSDIDGSVVSYTDATDTIHDLI